MFALFRKLNIRSMGSLSSWKSPVQMFFLGVLVGIFSFWILDIRRYSERLIVRNIYDFDDYVKSQKFHNDPETGHHDGIFCVDIIVLNAIS